MFRNPIHKRVFRLSLLTAAVLLLAGILYYIWYASRKHKDTSELKPEFNVEALAFIKEFETDLNAANKKYANRIVAVTGIVSATEAADTTLNIKMTDNASGSYIIFAFQKKNMEEARSLQPGDTVTIKGACSDGVYSEILQRHFISFTRSVIENNRK